MKSFLIPTLTLGILAGSIGQAQAITISFDDFQTNFGTGSADLVDELKFNRSSGGTITQNASQLLTNPATSLSKSIAGSTRLASVLTNGDQGVRIGNVNAQTRSAFFGVDASQSFGKFYTNAVSTATGTLKYTFTSALDLTAGGVNDVLRTTYAGNVGLGLTLFDGTNTLNIASTNLASGTLADYDLAFTDFSGFNWSSVASVQYNFTQTVSDQDFSFYFIGTKDTIPVPEPLTILGTLLAGGIGVAMKKKKQALQDSES